jgi:hypothetical protein
MRDEREKMICVAALSALAGILAHALVDAPLQIASLQLYSILDIAILTQLFSHRLYSRNALQIFDLRQP